MTQIYPEIATLVYGNPAPVTPRPTSSPSSSPTAQPPVVCTGHSFKLQLLTDDYGSETSWDLKDPNGNVIAEGSNHGNRQLIDATRCLEDGVHTFTIYDSYGYVFSFVLCLLAFKLITNLISMYQRWNMLRLWKWILQDMVQWY